MFSRPDPDRSGLGTHFGTLQAAIERLVDRGGWRGRFRRLDECDLREGDRIIEYAVRFERPLQARDISAWDDLPTVEFELRRLGVLSDEDYRYSRQNLDGAAAWAFLRRKIEEAGYDCVAYRNELEDIGSTSYIVWNVDQIGAGSEL